MSVVLLGACRSVGPPAVDEIHVSTLGDDGGRGTVAAPFRTIARAKAEVGVRIAAGLRLPLTVVVHEGTYELAAPLVFTARDCGTAACPIIYAAAPGERVVVSGGRRITGWRAADAGGWSAVLPEVRAGAWFFRQLFVGDRRAVRARWPDRDGELHLATVADGATRFTFDRPLPVDVSFDPSSELVVFENWSITRGAVAGCTDGQLTTATPMGWIGHGPATTASAGKPAFLEHAPQFLDRPGEWFLDRASGELSYFARPGEDPSLHTEVVASRLEQVVRLSGTPQAPVRYLGFRGIAFEHTAFALPAFGYREIQAAHYGTGIADETFVQPVAIECVYAEHCWFDRCRVAHAGASGIGLGPGCRANRIVGCTIEDIGGSGILVGWRGVGRASGQLSADWADVGAVPTGNEIRDCRVRRCGAESHGAVGVFVAFSADTRVAHNRVHDLPYTGISVGYRWDATPTSQVRCVVERNHIHDVTQKLADGGGIYTLGLQPGTVFAHNYIHDVGRSAFAHGGAPNNGFFVDEGSTGFRFEGNVVRATSGEPVRFNKSRREAHQWHGNHLGDAAAARRRAKAVIGSAGPRRSYR